MYIEQRLTPERLALLVKNRELWELFVVSICGNGNGVYDVPS
jgi:hypothetical protein